MASDKEMELIKKSQNEWEKGQLEKDLAKSPPRSDHFTLSSGTPIKPLYSPVDLENQKYVNDVSFPGEFPYTRGLYPNGYRSQLWNIQQVSGYGLAEDTNNRLKKLRSEGQSGFYGRDVINVVFDVPTHYGIDADAPEAQGEVGRLGVALNSLDDMEQMLDGFHPEKTFISFIINHPAIIILSMYIAHAEKVGVNQKVLSGVMQNDPLATFTCSKSYLFPPAASLKLVSDIFSYSIKYLPRWNLNGIGGYHYRESGGTAVQEIAFAVANAMAYVEAGLRVGLDVDDFVPRFSFFFSVHNNLFEEVAKLRAARRFWARVLKEKYKSKNPRSQMMRFHVQTAGSTLTAQQPVNNIIRITIQALAAILGGVQGLHTNSWDEALALPSEESVKLALRTQQIVAHESGVTETVDPMGGSYYLEYLTDEIEAQVEDYLKRIAAFGDNMYDAVIAGLEKGFFHKEIANAAYKYQQEIENGSRAVIGLNKFAEKEKLSVSIFKADPKARDRQSARLKALRNKRNNTALTSSLKQLFEAAKRDENLFPFVLDAVKHYGTLGEIIKVLTEVYGEYKDLAII
jgi:methylmalonyl-CoA mutase N-terminal domain/subunit